MIKTGPEEATSAVKRGLILIALTAIVIGTGLSAGPSLEIARDAALVQISLGLILTLYFVYRFMWAFLLDERSRENGNAFGAALLCSIPALWICLRTFIPGEVNLEQFGSYVWTTDFWLGVSWLATRCLVKLPDTPEVDG